MHTNLTLKHSSSFNSLIYLLQDGKTGFEIAEENDHSEVADYLLSKGLIPLRIVIERNINCIYTYESIVEGIDEILMYHGSLPYLRDEGVPVSLILSKFTSLDFKISNWLQRYWQYDKYLYGNEYVKYLRCI